MVINILYKLKHKHFNILVEIFIFDTHKKKIKNIGELSLLYIVPRH